MDSSEIISQLKNIENHHNNEDKKILEIVFKNLEKLTSQEIYFLKNHPQSVWLDYLIFRYKFLTYPKDKIVSDFPIYVLIEPISVCNLRCVMCFQIDDSFTSNKDLMGKMELSLFKKIIDELSLKGTKAITLASRGEPTLHPQLKEMLEYCSGKFFEIKINTNATRLTEELIHVILKSGVTDIVFSIDSYEKEDYEKIRVRGVFETVEKNVKLFQKIKKENYPESFCATRVSGVKVNKELDVKEFKKFWEKYVDHVSMQELDIRWDTYHNPLEIAAESPCINLWERMYIWFDGICNPCDMDYKSELSVGNLKDSSIQEIWNSKKYTNLRNDHQQGLRKNYFPCDRCPIGS